MENEIQVFQNQEFGEVRTFKEPDGSILFCGSDVAKALGYENTRKAIIDHCKGDGVTIRDVIDSLGRTQQAKFITRGNLIRLAASSQLPGADKFESWIFDEVIPAVMEHGAYATPDTLEKMILSPEFGIKVFTALKNEQEKRKAAQAKIEFDKPKVLFADSVAGSRQSILIREMAKFLKQNGIDIGEKRLFSWLRVNGYLIQKYGDDYNLPTQYSMDRGLMIIRERTYSDDVHTRILRTPMITGKGQQYFIHKFLSKKSA